MGYFVGRVCLRLGNQRPQIEAGFCGKDKLTTVVPRMLSVWVSTCVFVLLNWLSGVAFFFFANLQPELNSTQPHPHTPPAAPTLPTSAPRPQAVERTNSLGVCVLTTSDALVQLLARSLLFNSSYCLILLSTLVETAVQLALAYAPHCTAVFSNTRVQVQLRVLGHMHVCCDM